MSINLNEHCLETKTLKTFIFIKDIHIHIFENHLILSVSKDDLQ